MDNHKLGLVFFGQLGSGIGHAHVYDKVIELLEVRKGNVLPGFLPNNDGAKVAKLG